MARLGAQWVGLGGLAAAGRAPLLVCHLDPGFWLVPDVVDQQE